MLVGKRPIEIRLSPRSPSESDASSRAFTPERAADGHRVWIPLALLQAIDVLNHRTTQLISVAQELFDTADVVCGEHPAFESLRLRERLNLNEFLSTFDPVSQGLDLDDDEQVAEVVGCAERYQSAIRAFLSAEDLPSEIAAHELMPTAPVLRVPLFVVDEPERHLHPRAQRQLARWLADLVRGHDTQALVITHSVAFIERADAIAYVSRNPPADAIVRPCGVEELRALGEIAADLGIDRGELLAGVSIYLFVEGDSDKYVVESLFAERLRRIGVAVFPVRGATQLAQVVDAQVLLRYSTAKVVVLLDQLEHREINRLLTDPEFRASVARGRTEEQAVAKLLNEAIDHGRMPEVRGIPVEDSSSS